jgi:hypothetical protein
LNVFAGSYLQADDYGECICKSSSLLSLVLCEVQYLVIFCLAISVISGATGYICYLNGNRLSREDKLHHVKAAELRTKLGITMRGRVILSTERVPIWRNPKSFIVLQAESFDAAVRLDGFRDDFDIKQVDGFCIALRGSACYGKIYDWILQICRCLLNPEDNVKKENSQQSSCNPQRLQSRSYWIKFFNHKIAADSHLVSDWLRASTQEDRMIYFRKRVCKLQILRENNHTLFKQLKNIVDELMVKIGSLCKDRFVQILSEVMGAELSSQLECEICQKDSETNSAVELGFQRFDENVGYLRPLLQESNRLNHCVTFLQISVMLFSYHDAYSYLTADLLLMVQNFAGMAVSMALLLLKSLMSRTNQW